MIYRNIHSHVFTMNNAPKDFLRLFLPELAADTVEKVTNTQAGSRTLQSILSLGGNSGKRYANFLKIGKSKDQFTVFKELMGQYADKNMQFVALTLNMEYIGAGSSKSLYEGQLEEVIEIKRQFPDNIILFLGVDPRWQNGDSKRIRDVVKAKFETKIGTSRGQSIYPFAGLKIYPSTGYYVFDQRLKDTFEWAASEGVPVLSHTNYLGGLYNYDKNYIKQNLNAFNPYLNATYSSPTYQDDYNFFRWLVGNNQRIVNKRNCSYFLEPDTYRSVFEHFERNGQVLKICLAHFGGAKQIMASLGEHEDEEQRVPYGVKRTNWFRQIQDLLKQYEGAYTDISYDVAEGAKKGDNVLFKEFYNETNNVDYGRKILFGTDFFLAEQESEEKDTYNKFRDFASTHMLTNYNNTPMWDNIAGSNTDAFLKSRFFP